MLLKGLLTTDPADLAEFDKEGLDAIFRNLRKPPRALQGGAGRGATGGGRGLVDVEPFIVPAKSQMRIYASALAVKYYVATALFEVASYRNLLFLLKFSTQPSYYSHVHPIL